MPPKKASDSRQLTAEESDNSSTPSHQKGKRKRASKACDACHKKKIRCDSKQPCANCKDPSTCVYTPSTRKRGPRVGYIESLERRLSLMENLLRQADSPEKKELTATLLKDLAMPQKRKGSVRDRKLAAELAREEESMAEERHREASERLEKVAISMLNPKRSRRKQESESEEEEDFEDEDYDYGYEQQYSMPQPMLQPVINQPMSQSNASQWQESPHQFYNPSPATNYVAPTQPIYTNPPINLASINTANLMGLNPSLGATILGLQDNKDDPMMILDDAADPTSLLEDIGFDYLDHLDHIPRTPTPQVIGTLVRSPIVGKRKAPEEEELPPVPAVEGWLGLHDPSTAEINMPLISLFFSHTYPQLPMIHRASFLEKLVPKNQHSPLLLNAIYAVSARFSTDPMIMTTPHKPWLAGEPFFNRCKMILATTMDVPSVATVQALLILSMHASGSGKGSSAWMYTGMAIRMAQELFLNVDYEDLPLVRPLPWVERETRRRVWWCAFTMDRSVSAGADRPFTIDERDCHCSLPSEETIWDHTHPSVGMEEEEEGDKKGSLFQNARLPRYSLQNSLHSAVPGRGLSQYGVTVILFEIFGRCLRYAKETRRPGKKSEFNPDGLMECEASLENFKKALPTSHVIPLRPTNDAIYDQNMWHAAFVEILWHTSLIILHRPSFTTPNGTKANLMSSEPTIPVWPTPTSRDKCTVSAQRIAEVLETLIVPNPFLNRFSPFSPYCIFHTAVIHILNAIHPYVPSGSDKTAEEFGKQARHYAKVHVAALWRLKRYWTTGGRYLDSLQQMMKANGMEKDVEEAIEAERELSAQSPFLSLIEPGKIVPNNSLRLKQLQQTEQLLQLQLSVVHQMQEQVVQSMPRPEHSQDRLRMVRHELDAAEALASGLGRTMSPDLAIHENREPLALDRYNSSTYYRTVGPVAEGGMIEQQYYQPTEDYYYQQQHNQQHNQHGHSRQDLAAYYGASVVGQRSTNQ